MKTELHSLLAVVILFFFGLISPGPNFFVVIETTLNFGRSAGFVTGLGAATGDAVYATCGLFGAAQFIAAGGRVMRGVEFLGALYLLWLGIRMFRRRSATSTNPGSPSVSNRSAGRHFWRGLVTDLANPKTVVFFTSIFTVAVHPESSSALRAAMLVGIVLTSIAWRFMLSIIFSIPTIRRPYERTEPIVERVFGGILCLFGLHLVKRAAG
jgi:amino acid exporter